MKTSNKPDSIKSIEDIERIKNVFIAEPNKNNDRHLLFFILGLNLCLKPDELLTIKWNSIIDTTTGIIKDYIHYKSYKFYLNLSCKNSIYNYICKHADYKRDIYVFGHNKPLTIQSFNTCFRNIKSELKLDFNFSCLSLHKSFIYWQIKRNHFDYVKMTKLKEIYRDLEVGKEINGYCQYNIDNDYIYINDVNL